MKRFLALFLSFVILITSTPVTIAATFAGAPLYLESYKAAYSGFNTFGDYVETIIGVEHIRHPRTNEILLPDQPTFDKYGIIVFGNNTNVDFADLEAGYTHSNIEQREVYNDRPTGTMGYRYLGYSQKGDVPIIPLMSYNLNKQTYKNRTR